VEALEQAVDPGHLAWLAAQTHNIQLGTTVIVIPYRHPVHLVHQQNSRRRFAA